MHRILQRNTFLVKEKVGLFKAANNYDIFDPENGELLLECREDLGLFTRLMRYSDYRTNSPFNVAVRTPQGEPVLRVTRGWTFFLSHVKVYDDENELVGGYKQKLFSIGGSFRVLGPSDQELCTLKGKWTSWEFSFIAGNNELARVTKKWAGLGREFFTSADNYVLSISEQVPADNPVRILIFGAVMCIDMVLKEK